MLAYIFAALMLLGSCAPSAWADDSSQVTALRSELFQLQSGHGALKKQYDGLQGQLKKVEADIGKLNATIEQQLQAAQSKANVMAKDLQASLEKQLKQVEDKLNQLKQQLTSKEADKSSS